MEIISEQSKDGLGGGGAGQPGEEVEIMSFFRSLQPQTLVCCQPVGYLVYGVLQPCFDNDLVNIRAGRDEAAEFQA